MSFEAGLIIGLVLGGYLMYHLVLAILIKSRRVRHAIKQDSPHD